MSGSLRVASAAEIEEFAGAPATIRVRVVHPRRPPSSREIMHSWEPLRVGACVVGEIVGVAPHCMGVIRTWSEAGALPWELIPLGAAPSHSAFLFRRGRPIEETWPGFMDRWSNS